MSRVERSTEMLAIPVGSEVFTLSEESAAGLIQRLIASSPLLEGGRPEPGTTLEKLQDAMHSREPAAIDEADVVLIGVELEAWRLEVGDDLPNDAEELRSAISRRLR